MDTNSQNSQEKSKKTWPKSRYDRAMSLGVRPTTENRYHQMFLLYSDCNMDVNEIADKMGCSTSTVYQAIKTIEAQVMGAPENAKSGSLARQRRQAIALTQDLQQEELEARERDKSLAEKIVEQEVVDAKKHGRPIDLKVISVYLSIRHSVRRSTEVIGELLEKERKQAYDLALYWGVLQRAGLTINFNQQNNYAVDGQKMAKLAEIVEKYSTPKLNEPRPEHTSKSEVGADR